MAEFHGNAHVLSDLLTVILACTILAIDYHMSNGINDLA